MDCLLLFNGGMLSSSDVKVSTDSTKLCSTHYTSKFGLVNMWRRIGLLDRHLPCKAGDGLGVREDNTPEVNLECLITLKNIDTILLRTKETLMTSSSFIPGAVGV